MKIIKTPITTHDLFYFFNKTIVELKYSVQVTVNRE